MQIIQKQVDDTKTKFNINITRSDKDLKLPKLFWVPKLHKNPYKFRFIAGARNCRPTSERLSIRVNQGIKVIRENFHRYCKSIQKNTGYAHVVIFGMLFLLRSRVRWG